MEVFPECGKPLNLELGANLKIDAARVPQNLQALIPIVQKWSFDHLQDQDLFAARMQEERPDELERFNNAFSERVEREIQDWSDSLAFPTAVGEMTPEDWAHPYWQFLNVVKLAECTRVSKDSAEVEAMLNRVQEERRQETYSEATLAADVAFRNGEYGKYVELLAEYSDLLTPSQNKKLEIAARKTNS